MIISLESVRSKILSLTCYLWISISLVSCIEFPDKYTKVAPGPWRAELSLYGTSDAEVVPIDQKSLKDIRATKIDQVSAGKLPFTMNFVYPQPDSFYVEIINGEERIVVDDIRFGRSFQTAKDTIEIHFTEYNTMIKATIEDRIMEGHFIDFSRGNYKIPFVAKQGDNYRFTELKKPPISEISGKWKIRFEEESGSSYIGEMQLEADQNHLSGTIATETGDYRYLDGTVQGNKLYLSTFDGTHLFQLEGKIYGEDSIVGVFHSGNHYRSFWKATQGSGDLRNPDVILELGNEDVWDLQSLLLDSFGINPTLNWDKPVIVELMGTWCPNCKDASLFLNEIRKKHEEIQIIALAFERKNQKNPKAHIETYQQKLDIDYPIFYAGVASKSLASEKLPFVSKVYSFPSLFFFDKSKALQASYSGFYGPATEQYELEREKLNKMVLAISQ